MSPRCRAMAKVATTIADNMILGLAIQTGLIGLGIFVGLVWLSIALRSGGEEIRQDEWCIL